MAALTAAGVATSLGDGASAAAALIEGFTTHILTGRPLVIAKYAMSLDGRIATHTGHSRWITGPLARAHLHRLRASVDAILVGAGTVRADDPQLTARPPDWPGQPYQPLRVIVSRHGRLSLSARVFDATLPGRTLLVTANDLPPTDARTLQGRGLELLQLPDGTDGVDLPALLDYLGSIDITSLLVEGGSQTLAGFFGQHLVHKVLTYVAPVIIGGHAAPGPVGGRGVPTMALADRLTAPTYQSLGADLLISAYQPALTAHLPLAGRLPAAEALLASWPLEQG
jgi:diaminohydroxyphosphoribosylaminopyrimidine deaminase/5-amino-6-(5-phosphoribosylamino)uracil reductase